MSDNFYHDRPEFDCVNLDVCTALDTENKKLKQRIAELESQLRWIPVSERLPPENGQYDVYEYNCIQSCIWFLDGEFYIEQDKESYLIKPTHWRHITPPEGE